MARAMASRLFDLGRRVQINRSYVSEHTEGVCMHGKPGTVDTLYSVFCNNLHMGSNSAVNLPISSRKITIGKLIVSY